MFGDIVNHFCAGGSVGHSELLNADLCLCAGVEVRYSCRKKMYCSLLSQMARDTSRVFISIPVRGLYNFNLSNFDLEIGNFYCFFCILKFSITKSKIIRNLKTPEWNSGPISSSSQTSVTTAVRNLKLFLGLGEQRDTWYTDLHVGIVLIHINIYIII